MSPDVIVIGAGIQGLATALNLALRGRSVVVIEKAAPARHASGVNAGGVRSLWRHPAEIPLALASLEIWHDIEALLGADCQYHSNGTLIIAETEGDMGILEDRVAELAPLGYHHEELLGRAALRAIVPDVAPHCVGGLIARAEGSASPYHATWAFYERARREQVAFRIGEPASQIERCPAGWRVQVGAERLEAGVLVNCAGAWGDAIAAMIGDQAPLARNAYTMMVTQRVPRFLGPVCTAVSRKLSFKQTDAGTLLIGGGHLGSIDASGEVATPDPRRMALSAQTVVDMFPLMRDVPVARSWCGIEGVTPDELPIIGPSPGGRGAFHAFGFSGHGFALGPIIGRLMAELVVDGKTSLPIEPFAMTRFYPAG